MPQTLHDVVVYKNGKLYRAQIKAEKGKDGKYLLPNGYSTKGFYERVSDGDWTKLPWLSRPSSVARKSTTRQSKAKPNSRRGSSAKTTRKSRKSKAEPINTKRYSNRPSPPFHAKDYPNKTKKGNDGNMYKSKANVNGVYTWRKV